ncbi:putative ribonuclease H-like domain-containing protein [Tanacetum coccineum]
MNGDAPAIASASAGTKGLIPPKTVEQKLARKNELKAKSTLLLAIPDEHLLKFHGIKDAKTLWEAIKASAKDKTGLGYDSQMNKSEVVHSVFNSRESDVDDSLVNDRFKTGEGFHAVPPPYTGNYMPPRPDLSFAGLDDSVYKTKVSETKNSVSKTSKDIIEKPKTVRPSAPIIKDWDTDSNNDSVFRPKSDPDQTKPKFIKINFVKSGENVKSVNKENTHRQVKYPKKSQSPRGNKRNWNGMMTQKLGNGFEFMIKACFVCGSFNHLIKDCDFHDNKMVEKPVLNNKGMVTGQREIRPVWNNAWRVNHQNKLTHPHPKRNFVLTAVATKSGQVPVNAAKQSSLRAATSISTARPVNTVAPKPKVNDALPITYSYFKAHSPGNPQYTLQDQRIFDSRCSRHMTGNKSFLTNYQEIDGEFVAFGGSPKGGKITRKGKIRTGKLDFEDVYFVKELKFNLFSVSQMCDKKNSVLFTETECLVLSPDFKLLDESQVLLKVPRHDNMYSFDLKNVVPSGGLTCLFAKATIDESNLWHRRLGHINFKTMNKLIRGNLVRDLPSKLFQNDHTCVACQKGEQHKASSFLLATKDETSGILKTFITGIENQINHKVKTIRCDNGIEFKNNDMNQFCRMKGIKREFSVARTPQQNGVAKRNNRTLIEAARTILADLLLPTTFWAEVVNTSCYVQNRVLVNPLGKFDEKADEGFLVRYSINSKAFRVFNTRTRKVEENMHITFLENKPNVAGSGPDWLFDIDLLTNSMNNEPITAWNQTNRNAEDAVADDAGKKITEEPANEGERNGQEKEGEASNKEGDQHVQDLRAELDKLLVQQKEGYANNTNKVSTISPSVSVAGQSFVNDLPTDPLMPDLEDTTDLLNTGIFSGAYDDEDVGAEADLNNLETTMNVSPIPTTRIHKDHPKDQIIRDINLATQTRRMINISKEHAMRLVDLPKGKHAIGTKCVYKNKKDERGIVVRNKERLVAQGYTQEEGIDYDKVFAPVARIEAIRLFLAHASFMGFIVYPMDVKSAFLYGTIEEEVYVCQPPGFEDPQFPDKVYKVEKALYGLHQAPRAWYETLSTYLLENRFRRGTIDKTLFIKKDKDDAHEIPDEFYGGAHFLLRVAESTPIKTNKALLKDEEAEDVDVYLCRSMIGSLMYLTAFRPDIMFAVCTCAWFQVTPKVSHLHAMKRIFRYLKGQPKLGLWYPRDSPFNLEAFFDSDYAGASLDRKSTTGGCQFLAKGVVDLKSNA